MKRIFSAVAVAMVLALGSAAHAGSLAGPGVDTGVMRGEFGSSFTTTYTRAFVGGEVAQVRVHSYGTTFLELRVYDEHGNLIGADTDRVGDAVVTWVPLYTGTFKIQIINRAAVANPYVISFN